jgi:hypothetical protein
MEPGGICHVHKSRHHFSFGTSYVWRRLFPALASIYGRLGITKLSTLRASAILKFIRTALRALG